MTILEHIDTTIAELIESCNGNFRWGSCNERDQARAQYPHANIYVESEECQDSSSGVWSQEYAQQVSIRIEVWCKLDGEYERPWIEIRKKLYQALDDLKAIFGTAWNLNGYCDTIMYRGCEIVDEPGGDQLIPAKMITHWLVNYEQDRLDPTSSTQ